MMPSRQWEKYVGLPFKDHGRDWQGVDCWGLVRLALKTECNIEVPSYGEISAMDLVKVAELVGYESDVDPWRRVTEAKQFDVAVMHKKHDAVHVGIMASDTHILHVEPHTAAVLVPLDSPLITFRAVKLRRHKDLMHV